MIMKIDEVKKFIEKQDQIRFAYLFGSHARGGEGPLSDVDIAVYLDEKLNESERFDLRLRLIGDISAILGIREPDKLDVIVINDAPLNLNQEIIKNGKILVIKDFEKMVEVESRILSKYLDRIYYERRGLNEFLDRVLKRGRL